MKKIKKEEEKYEEYQNTYQYLMRHLDIFMENLYNGI